MNTPSPIPAGWFPDPLGRHEHRYFNGRSWTADVADEGERRIDPHGTHPGGPAHGRPTSPSDPPHRSNGIATASLVCGVIAVMLAWVPFLVVVGAAMTVLALVFGIQARRRAAELATGHHFATAGLVLAGVGAVLTIVGVWLTVVTWREIDAFVSPAGHELGEPACAVDTGLAVAEGTITNGARDTADFTVFVVFSFGQASPRDTVIVTTEVGGVPPDQSAAWEARTPVRSNIETCDVELDVYGPFPFGVEVSRP